LFYLHVFNFDVFTKTVSHLEIRLRKSAFKNAALSCFLVSSRTHKLSLCKLQLLRCSLATRVARWHIFRPKIPIWVNLGWICNGRCWYVYFIAIWSILRPLEIFCGYLVFGIFFNVLVRCTKRNLATLLATQRSRRTEEKKLERMNLRDRGRDKKSKAQLSVETNFGALLEMFRIFRLIS
jgi:hypothetical protein